MQCKYFPFQDFKILYLKSLNYSKDILILIFLNAWRNGMWKHLPHANPSPFHYYHSHSSPFSRWFGKSYIVLYLSHLSGAALLFSVIINIGEEITSLWSLFGTFIWKRKKRSSGIHFKDNMRSDHTPLPPARFHHTLRVFWKAESVLLCFVTLGAAFQQLFQFTLERTKMLLNSDFLNSLRLCYEVFSKWQRSHLWHSYF